MDAPKCSCGEQLTVIDDPERTRPWTLCPHCDEAGPGWHPQECGRCQRYNKARQ